jgi:hypothetical protein
MYPVKTKYPLTYPEPIELIYLDFEPRFKWFWDSYYQEYKPLLKREFFPLMFREAACCNLLKYIVPLYIGTDGMLVNAEGNRRLCLQKHYGIRTCGVLGEKSFWREQIGRLDFNNQPSPLHPTPVRH